MISKLYEASKAGVQVDLLVRSICCLAAGVPGQSENIRIHRIVDRYLEHARIFVFHNNGEPNYFMGSADWMNRNLHSRIEVVFPVYEKALQDELSEILRLQLEDNQKAVYITPELNNPRVLNDKLPTSSQKSIYDFVKQKSE
jgi:polyphosphate kinase